MRSFLLILVCLTALSSAPVAAKPQSTSTNKAEAVKYRPQFSVDLGGAVAWYATERLNRYCAALEDSLGAPHLFRAKTGLPTFTAGLRVYPSRAIAVRVQAILRRNGEQIVGVSHVGASLLVSPVHTPFASIWLGGGIARQSLITSQKYHHVWVENLGGWLDSISIVSQVRVAYPVDLQVEIHPRAYSRYTVLLGVKRLISAGASVNYSALESRPVDMDAWVASASLSAAF